MHILPRGWRRNTMDIFFSNHLMKKIAKWEQYTHWMSFNTNSRKDFIESRGNPHRLTHTSNIPSWKSYAMIIIVFNLILLLTCTLVFTLILLLTCTLIHKLLLCFPTQRGFSSFTKEKTSKVYPSKRGNPHRVTFKIYFCMQMVI